MIDIYIYIYVYVYTYIYIYAYMSTYCSRLASSPEMRRARSPEGLRFRSLEKAPGPRSSIDLEFNGFSWQHNRDLQGVPEGHVEAVEFVSHTVMPGVLEATPSSLMFALCRSFRSSNWRICFKASGCWSRPGLAEFCRPNCRFRVW